MFALTPGSSGAITLPPLAQVSPFGEVAYAIRFLLESSPVYHIFHVEPSFRTDGSAAAKLSAEPAGPWFTTGTGRAPPPVYFDQVTPSVEVARPIPPNTSAWPEYHILNGALASAG